MAEQSTVTVVVASKKGSYLDGMGNRYDLEKGDNAFNSEVAANLIATNPTELEDGGQRETRTSEENPVFAE